MPGSGLYFERHFPVLKKTILAKQKFSFVPSGCNMLNDYSDNYFTLLVKISQDAFVLPQHDNLAKTDPRKCLFV